MNAEIQSVCNELISALIEGGLQGGLIIGLICACLKLFPGANAATRHGAWFATLLVAALLPLVIFLGSILKTAAPEPKPAAAETVAVDPLEGSLPDPEILPRIEEWELETPPLPETTAEPIVPVTEPEPTPAFMWQLTIPNYIAAVLVACWLVLATIRLGVLAAQLVLLRRIKRTASVAAENLRDSFNSTVIGMDLSRNPRLLISEKAAAPMVVGFFRPAMLLPKTIAERCSSIQLEHLFRHELAHLARRDDWTNLLQQIIVAVFFFHPGIAFVSRRLTSEREIACDDHALAISRAPREYALFLTEFASQMKGRDFTAAPAAWSGKSQLKERIGMILNGKRNASPRVSRAGVGAIAATAATLAIATVILTPRFVVAAEEPEALPVPAAPAAPAADVVVAVEPVKVSVPAITVETAPSGLTIASVTTGPRKKDLLAPGAEVYVAPKPVQIAPMKPVGPQKIAGLPQPEPEPRPRIKSAPRPDRDDGDLEHRIDRLERMVEDLLKRDKQSREESMFWKKNFNNQEWNSQFRNEMDKADSQLRNEMEKGRREAERAQRDAERAVREQKMAMENQLHAAQREQSAQMSNRESLKARRQSLEARRKQLEKEIEAIEKEMQRDDDAKEKRAAEKEREKEREKRSKAEEKEKEKLDKKSRDTGKDSDDGDKAK